MQLAAGVSMCGWLNKSGAKVNKRRLSLGLFIGTNFGNTTLQVANVSGKLDFFSIYLQVTWSPKKKSQAS